MAENIYEKTFNSTKPDQLVQFTGIVVTYNDAQRLRECLNSLKFCEQLLVIDLGSVDESVEIACECGAEVVNHKWVPIVEQVWPYAVSLARHSWIIRADPDEICPTSLADDLRKIIAKSEFVGVIETPHQYYFCGKPLTTTVWGNIKYIGKVFHRDRVRIEPCVHRGIRCRNGYSSQRIKRTEDNVVQHYWVDTFAQLLEKHKRYIKAEGKSRYDSGQRFSWLKMIVSVCRELKANLINYRGLFGGFNGVFLSFFYGWYIFESWLSLRKYERCQINNRERLF